VDRHNGYSAIREQLASRCANHGRRVEHYEMAGYLTAISLAKRMGANDIVSLLNETLSEEQAAEKKLRQIASGERKPESSSGVVQSLLLLKAFPASAATRAPGTKRTEAERYHGITPAETGSLIIYYLKC
jgi:hypothetical protein